jgi:hypothetical protein
MNLEDIMSCEINQTQKDKSLWFSVCEVSGIVKYIGTESRIMVTRDWVGGEEWMGIYCLMVMACEDEKVLNMNSGDNCTACENT